ILPAALIAPGVLFVPAFELPEALRRCPPSKKSAFAARSAPAARNRFAQRCNSQIVPPACVPAAGNSVPPRAPVPARAPGKPVFAPAPDLTLDLLSAEDIRNFAIAVSPAPACANPRANVRRRRYRSSPTLRESARSRPRPKQSRVSVPPSAPYLDSLLRSEERRVGKEFRSAFTT